MFHYTDANGLIGIIGGKSFWATDMRFLNDSMEVEAGIKGLTKLCKDYLERFEKSKNIVESTSCQIYELIPEFVNNNLRKRSLYTVSFSKSEDNLRQWMAYCPPNAGYCIKFNKEKLLINPGAEREKGVVARVQDVEYSSNYLEELISLKTIAKEVKKISEKKIDQNSYLISLTNDLLFGSCAMKNNEFHDEKETRLIIQSNLIKSNPGKFRVKSGVIVPYFEYPVDVDSIEEITIGPSLNRELAKQGLQDFLERNKINCEIKFSNCSLRVF